MSGPVAAEAIDFDVWGCRGPRNLPCGSSSIGVHTSCYSVLEGERLFVLDAGFGLIALARAMRERSRFEKARRIHVLLTHAHIDHWEGLKDVDWFWRPGNGLEVTLYGAHQTLRSIEASFAYPAFVPLETLAAATLRCFARCPLEPGERRRIDGWELETVSLNHYIGAGESVRPVDTLGFRLRRESGPAVVYLCDHEPTAASRGEEDRVTRGADLAVLDSYHARVADQAFGHGSKEHVATMARAHPQTLILAGHLNSSLEDSRIVETLARFGGGLDNLRLAEEGRCWRWSAEQGRFAARGPGDDAA